MVTKSIEQVVTEAAQWMNIEGVAGIGQGKAGRKDCIVVLVRVKTPELEKAIPREYEGYPVRIEEVGVIRADSPGK